MPTPTGHAQADDLFNAFNPVVQQFGGKLNTQKEKELVMWLQTVPGDFKNAFDDYRNKHIFDFTGDWDDPFALENSFKNHQAEEEEFIKKWHTKAAGSKPGRYLEHLSKMAKLEIQKSQGEAIENQKNWRAAHENRRLNESFGHILGQLGVTLELTDAITQAEKHVVHYATVRQLGAGEKENLFDYVNKAMHQRHVDVELGNIKNVIDLENRLSVINKQYSDIMPLRTRDVFDEKGNVTGKEEIPYNYPGMKEYNDEMLKKHTERINGETTAYFQNAEAARRRAIASGKYDEAVKIDKEFGPKLNRSYMPEYEREYANLGDGGRITLQNAFNTKMDEAYKSQAEKGERVLPPITAAEIIHAYLNKSNFVVTDPKTGEGFSFDNLRDGLDKWLFLEKAAHELAYGDGPEAEVMWRRKLYGTPEKDGLVKQFKKEMKEVMTSGIYKEYWNDFNRIFDLDTYTDEKNKNSPFYVKTKTSDKERETYAQSVMELSEDLFFNMNPDRTDFKERIKVFIDADVHRRMQLGTSHATEADEINNLADFSEGVQSNKYGDYRDYLFSVTDVLGTKFFSDDADRDNLRWNTRAKDFKRDAEAARERECNGYLMKMIMPDNPNIRAALQKNTSLGWMIPNDSENDPIAKGVLIIKDGPAELKGVYKLGYEPNWLVAEKLNEKTGEYESTEFRMPRPQTANQQRNAMQNLRDEIKAEKIPEAARFRTQPPPGTNISLDQWSRWYSEDDKAIEWAKYIQGK